MRSQQYSYYTKRLHELRTSVEQTEKEYLRNKTLYQKEVISQEEYEKYYFQFENQKNELVSFTESQLSSWNTDLNTYRNSHSEMNTTLKQEVKDKDLYIVRSPVTGTIDQFTGIYMGGNLMAGQSIAIISPDSTLYFEIYVGPRDIGYIYPDMPVVVQVESFNYNQWGTISGSVKEISSDFLTDNQGNSFYKIKCSMDRDYLELKNGHHGKLKKGMTVNARFMITRRSLFNLLYQKLDDWINPTRYLINS